MRCDAMVHAEMWVMDDHSLVLDHMSSLGQ
jgi:hypothetical protein